MCEGINNDRPSVAGSAAMTVAAAQLELIGSVDA
jgi:hypothetical protein